MANSRQNGGKFTFKYSKQKIDNTRITQISIYKICSTWVETLIIQIIKNMTDSFKAYKHVSDHNSIDCQFAEKKNCPNSVVISTAFYMHLFW